MKRNQSQYDPDLLQMQQQVDLMKSMGLMQDPTQQAMGLVQLMNTSQAPGIQQEQFGREMGFKELMGQQETDYRNRTLEAQQQHQAWQRQSGNRELDMRGEGVGLEREKLGLYQQNAEREAQLRKVSEVMDLLKLLTQGAIQPTMPGETPVLNRQAVGQFGEQMLPGFSQFFSGQPAAGTGWEGMMGKMGIPDDVLFNAMKQHGLK